MTTITPEIALPSHLSRITARQKLIVRILLSAAAFIGLYVAAALGLWYLREPFLRMGQWGYIGSVAAELAGSASMFIPLPGSAITFSLGSTLNPWILGAIGGVGAAVGEMTGYWLGATGRGALEGGRFYSKFQRVTRRWAGPVLFTFAVMPIPFDFAGIWAGSGRYPLWRFFLFVTPGKIMKITGYAVAGSYSIG